MSSILVEKRTGTDRFCRKSSFRSSRSAADRNRKDLVMTTVVTPHLNLRGDARAALEHYRDAFGGELTAVTYAQMGGPHDPAQADLIIWGEVAAPDGFRVMAYDVQTEKPWDQGANAFYVSVRTTDPAALEAAFPVLADGGEVQVPLGPSPWAPLYGMVRDRFGVVWVLDVAPAA
jgi:PhnB protein